MPVRKLRRAAPVGRVAVDLRREVEQRLVARAVVEPRDAPHLVAPAAVVPVMLQEALFGVLCQPFAIGREERRNALVAREFVVVLHDPADGHVGQQVAVAALVVQRRTEPPVGLLRREDTLDPEARLGEHLGILEQVGRGGITPQPVGNLLPAVRRAAPQPGVVLLLEPDADLPEVAVQPLGLKLQLTGHPPRRADGAHRQRNEILGLQRRKVAHIVGVPGGGVGTVDRLEAFAPARRAGQQHDGDKVSECFLHG